MNKYIGTNPIKCEKLTKRWRIIELLKFYLACEHKLSKYLVKYDIHISIRGYIRIHNYKSFLHLFIGVDNSKGRVRKLHSFSHSRISKTV